MVSEAPVHHVDEHWPTIGDLLRGWRQGVVWQKSDKSGQMPPGFLRVKKVKIHLTRVGICQ